MIKLQIFIIIAFGFISQIYSQADATLPFDEYCRFHKYPVEIHQLITNDGYMLTVFRTQKKETQISSEKPPVLLMHGLLSSADCFIDNEEGKSPAFMLANVGYDVWVGNVRGNKYSREHTSLNPDHDDKFWDFSWQDMSEHDIPTMVNFVYEKTQKKVNYIGHSQGTLVMFAALANNATFETKLQSFTALGPAVFVDHMKSNLAKLIANDVVMGILKRLNFNEFMPKNWAITNFGHIFCEYFGNICNDLVAWLTNYDPKLDNASRYNYLAGHDPSGTSLRNMNHFKQMLGNHLQTLRKYDFGKEENMKRYNSTSPPEYNIKNLKFDNMFIFRGTADKLVSMEDSQILVDILSEKNPKLQDNVYDLGHISFFIGKDMSFMNKVIENLDNLNGNKENLKSFLK